MGGTIIGSEFFLSGCAADRSEEVFISDEDIHFLDEVGETILPETDQSPGAKAARIGEFMSLMVHDCYSEEEQEIFLSGIKSLNTRAKETFSSNFIALKPAQKHELLVILDKEASGNQEHYFSMIKQLTILGYFTSKPGVTIAQRYNPIPGKFIGCIPYEEGDKIFAGRV